MRTITIKKQLSNNLENPWFFRYVYSGWENPAAIVYTLDNGQFLALVNSASTGYSQKVFKTTASACKWIEERLRKWSFQGDVVTYTFDIVSR